MFIGGLILGICLILVVEVIALFIFYKKSKRKEIKK